MKYASMKNTAVKKVIGVREVAGFIQRSFLSREHRSGPAEEIKFI